MGPVELGTKTTVLARVTFTVSLDWFPFWVTCLQSTLSHPVHLKFISASSSKRPFIFCNCNLPRICFSTYPPSTTIHLSQPLPQLVGHHLRLSSVLERISRPSCEQVYTINTSHRKQLTFLYEYPLHWALLPIKMHNRTLLFGSKVLKHGRHFDYWNQSMNMRTCVCYLDFFILKDIL
jgi:hypothetical protein